MEKIMGIEQSYIIQKVNAFFEWLREAVSQPYTQNREQRRRSKRISGSKNTDGKYFGGVKPDKKHRVQRFLVDKGEL